MQKSPIHSIATPPHLLCSAAWISTQPSPGVKISFCFQVIYVRIQRMSCNVGYKRTKMSFIWLCLQQYSMLGLLIWPTRMCFPQRLWKGKVLGTNHIAAFISRDFFPKCHFGCISDKVRKSLDAFRTLFRTYLKCIPNASEMYQKSIPNSNKNTIFLQNKPSIHPETNQISSIHCKK